MSKTINLEPGQTSVTFVEEGVDVTPSLNFLPWVPANFEEMFEHLQKDCLDIMVDRQRKYGPNNIPKFGTFGTLVRMTDKFERLNTLHERFQDLKDDASYSDESLEDTLIDIANYANIMRAQLKGYWTKDKCPKLKENL